MKRVVIIVEVPDDHKAHEVAEEIYVYTAWPVTPWEWGDFWLDEANGRIPGR